MQVLPIASGKGGVGKSLLAANLSIALSQAGKRVYLADLDLGGSNLHLILGLRGMYQGIGTFLSNPDVSFEQIILETEYPNLSFIPGDGEIPGTANLKSSQKKALIRKLLSLEADYLVLDLGAGTNNNILDFFLSSGQGIVITTPTPTALLNAYLFLKNSIFRIMYTSFRRNSRALEYLEELRKEGSPFQRVYIPRLLATVRKEDPESYAAYLESMEKFHPRVVLNMLEDPKDADTIRKLRRSCTQYLDLDIEHLGIIYRDDLQDIALGSRLPIISYKPQSVLSQAIYRIADKLLHLETYGGAPLDLEFLDDSFQAAGMEAEIDYEAKLQYLEELLHCGALSSGDLIETIKTQQFEISRLKKENQLLKSKVAQYLGAAQGAANG